MPLRFTIAFMIFSLTACQSYKKSLAEAEQYEQAGMYEEAIDRYSVLYRSKPNRPEAHIRMKNAAEAELNRIYSNARMLKGQGQFEQALRTLDEADAFKIRFQWLNINEPFNTEGILQEIHQGLADRYYLLAEEAVKDEKWDEAREYIRKSRKYDRSRRELDYLMLMVDIVPEFKKGMKAKELGLYQEAYYYFERVSELDADFSNVLQHMQECLDKSAFTATYVHFTLDGSNNSRDKAIITSVKQEILQLKNPFIKLVARDDIDVLIEEQRNSMSGAFDEEAAVEAGKLLGAEYVIVGEILDMSTRQSNLKRTRHKGFAGPTTQSRKVEYDVNSRNLTHIVSFRYHLMNAETGEVLAAENIPYTYEDEVRWINYNGDPDLLYPGDWKYRLLGSNIDKVFREKEMKDEIDQLIHARRVNLSPAELEHRFISFIGEEIGRKIDRFANERPLLEIR